MDKKKSAIIINVVLLVWYFLSMVGLKIGSKCSHGRRFERIL